MKEGSDSPSLWGHPTRWTVIAQASGSAGSSEANGAWRELVQRYRGPVQQTIQRMLYRHPHRDEIADEFFAFLFEKGILGRADPTKGRFRCFIQGVIRNYVRQALRRHQRAGEPLALEADAPILDCRLELEELEEAAWSAGVLGNAAGRLIKEHPRQGELLLRCHGVPPFDRCGRQELCEEFALSSNALNVSLHRARKRLGELILLEIQPTVENESDYRSEVAILVKRLLEAHPGLVPSDTAAEKGEI